MINSNKLNSNVPIENIIGSLKRLQYSLWDSIKNLYASNEEMNILEVNDPYLVIALTSRCIKFKEVL